MISLKSMTISFVTCLPFLLCYTTLAQSNGSAQAHKKPNVIVIYTDDQGTLDLNIYGAKDLYTPNIDALAKRGVRFTQFYAAAPVCSPSRASLMTGRYPQRAQLATNASSEKGGKTEMPSSQLTMAELFKSAGYTTAHIGKWHMGYTPAAMPNQQGFDYSFGHMGGCIDNYSHFFYWQGPNRHDLWRNGEEVWEDGKYFPDLMVKELNGFVEKNKHKPFFIYWALNIPHYPLQGEDKWRKYYKELPAPRREYAALISTMDEKIGMVLNKLKALALDKNTIVILQSDHGHSEEERTFNGGGYAGKYSGSKFSLLEGGIRVPSMISWPGNIPQNETRDQFAVNVDWFPTLAALCNIPLPERKIDGKSLVEVIRSANAPSPHETFFWQSGGGESPQWAVRQGEWKLMFNPIGYKGTAPESNRKLYLFNMKTDSEEKKNLSKEHAEIVETLSKKYQQWMEEVQTQ
jgi:arylsulfatase A